MMAIQHATWPDADEKMGVWLQANPCGIEVMFIPRSPDGEPEILHYTDTDSEE